MVMRLIILLAIVRFSKIGKVRGILEMFNSHLT